MKKIASLLIAAILLVGCSGTKTTTVGNAEVGYISLPEEVAAGYTEGDTYVQYTDYTSTDGYYGLVHMYRVELENQTFAEYGALTSYYLDSYLAEDTEVTYNASSTSPVTTKNGYSAYRATATSEAGWISENFVIECTDEEGNTYVVEILIDYSESAYKGMGDLILDSFTTTAAQ